MASRAVPLAEWISDFGLLDSQVEGIGPDRDRAGKASPKGNADLPEPGQILAVTGGRVPLVEALARAAAGGATGPGAQTGAAHFATSSGKRHLDVGSGSRNAHAPEVLVRRSSSLPSGRLIHVTPSSVLANSGGTSATESVPPGGGWDRNDGTANRSEGPSIRGHARRRVPHFFAAAATHGQNARRWRSHAVAVGRRPPPTAASADAQ